MEETSLVVSIIGTVLSLIGIFITIFIAFQNGSIKKQINQELKVQLSLDEFNEKKKSYLNVLKKYENGKINTDDELHKLVSMLTKANHIINNINGEFCEKCKLSINNALSGLSVSDGNPSIIRCNVNLIADLEASFEDVTCIVR